MFKPSEIQDKVKKIAQTISEDYQGKKLLVVGILIGSFAFLKDLVSNLTIPCEIDFLSVSSYEKSTRVEKELKFKKHLDHDPSGKHVLIVEDIVDSGLTLALLKKYLEDLNCTSVKTCSLLFKKENLVIKDIQIEYTGFICPNKFVVGYGMDYDQEFRSLDFIASLKPQFHEP